MQLCHCVYNEFSITCTGCTRCNHECHACSTMPQPADIICLCSLKVKGFAIPVCLDRTMVQTSLHNLARQRPCPAKEHQFLNEKTELFICICTHRVPQSPHDMAGLQTSFGMNEIPATGSCKVGSPFLSKHEGVL